MSADDTVQVYFTISDDFSWSKHVVGVGFTTVEQRFKILLYSSYTTCQ